MGKQQPPKATAQPVAHRVSAEDSQFYKSKRHVFDRELKELLAEKSFHDIEDKFFDLGQFLERHPDAKTIIS